MRMLLRSPGPGEAISEGVDKSTPELTLGSIIELLKLVAILKSELARERLDMFLNWWY